MFMLIGEVVKKAQGRSQTQPSFDEAIAILKPRFLNYYIGRATMLLKMVELHGVYVNKSTHESMKVLCRKFKK